MNKKGIIIANMGGARTPKELKLFLRKMFLDKRIIGSPLRYLVSAVVPEIRYKKVWKNYELIGGSRIYKITDSLVKKLQNFTDDKVVFAMRYTKPGIKDVIYQFDEVIIVPLYPHYSTTTTESIIDEIKKSKFSGKFKIIKDIYKNQDFNDLIIRDINKSVNNPKDWNIIFSAHGLPKSISNKGDKYVDEIREHISVLQTRLTNFKSISIGFQSRVGPVEWEKPYLEDVLDKFVGQNVLIYPISFIIDNSETDYELKIEYANVAKEKGVNKYVVVDCINDSDKFVEILNEYIKKHR